MRAVIVAFVSVAALATASVQATPLSPKPSAIELGTAPFIELVDHGCAWGCHHVHRYREQGVSLSR